MLLCFSTRHNDTTHRVESPASRIASFSVHLSGSLTLLHSTLLFFSTLLTLLLPRMSMKKVPWRSMRCCTFFCSTSGGEELGKTIAMRYMRGFSTKIPERERDREAGETRKQTMHNVGKDEDRGRLMNRLFQHQSHNVVIHMCEQLQHTLKIHGFLLSFSLIPSNILSHSYEHWAGLGLYTHTHTHQAPISTDRVSESHPWVSAWHRQTR